MAQTTGSFFNNSYSFSIAGDYGGFEETLSDITLNAVEVIEYLSDFVSWNGQLDFVVFFDGPVNFGPDGIFEHSLGNGLLPAYGGTTEDGRTFAHSEALTGIDANGLDYDLGLYLLPNTDGRLTNYGSPLFIDPSPDAYATVEIPSGTHDFFSIFLHEVLHGMAFWSTGQHAGFPDSAFDDQTVERDGQFYFEGDSVLSLLGQGLPLAVFGSRDHYGLNINGESPVNRGLLWEFGNYEQNRWHLGQLELAVLEDLGYEVANNDLLPLVEQLDYLPIEGELFTGTDRNDSLRTSIGNDTIDGGAGEDTVIFSGNRNSYSLTLSSFETIIEDRRINGNGTDTLLSIELLEFDTDLVGTPFNLQQFGGATGLAAADFESFIEFYIAYFNRAPDAVGLNFWGTAFANGTTLQEMATLFVDQVETRATYPDGTSNTDFVTAVYDNVLGRIPDQDGFNFWVDMLNRSEDTGVTRDQFILEVLRGVQDGSPDRAYLDSKVDIGAYFAVHRGMSDTDNASAAMALFDGSQGSVNDALAAIDRYYQDALDPNNGEFLMQVVGVLDNPFA